MHVVVIYTSMVGKENSVVRAVIRLGLGIPGIVFCFLAGVRTITSSNHLDRLRAHPACHSTALGVSFPGLKRRDCEADNYHLILRLRMSGALPFITPWPT